MNKKGNVKVSKRNKLGYGVFFTKQQKKKIIELVDKGNLAEAQRIILDLLDKEFGIDETDSRQPDTTN